MKVAINVGHGGFNLSEAAFEKLMTRKNIRFEKTVNQYGHVEYYAAGHINDDAHYLDEMKIIADRSDPDLIAVIELMGIAANGTYSELGVVTIPDGIKWHIAEYDGWEHVAEDHRTWCVPAPQLSLDL